MTKLKAPGPVHLASNSNRPKTGHTQTAPKRPFPVSNSIKSGPVIQFGTIDRKMSFGSWIPESTYTLPVMSMESLGKLLQHSN